MAAVYASMRGTERHAWQLKIAAWMVVFRLGSQSTEGATGCHFVVEDARVHKVCCQYKKCLAIDSCIMGFVIGKC